MTPFGPLIHHESYTRVIDPPEQDVSESLRAYAPYLDGGDPFYSPHLTRTGTTCEIATA